jgi:hypothetical protein
VYWLLEASQHEPSIAAAPVGLEPSSAKEPFVVSATLIVTVILCGSTPIITFFGLLILLTSSVAGNQYVDELGSALRAGQTPPDPRLVTVNGGPQSR